MLSGLLQGHTEVPFLGFVQMFHAYHFFARKLALPRRVTAGDKNAEDVSIHAHKEELLGLLAGFRSGFSSLFEVKMSIPREADSDSKKASADLMVAEK